MSILKDLREEIRKKRDDDQLSWRQVDFLQKAYVKENPLCVKCGTEKNATYDHIIPVSILSDFNIDAKKEFWEENSQSMCRACNVMKANHLDFSNKKTPILLNKLLEKYDKDNSNKHGNRD